MIWQVFDLIRTRRTPAHSYTQTVMCVCLIGLAVLNERIQWMASEFHCSNAIFHPSSSFTMRRHAFAMDFWLPLPTALSLSLSVPLPCILASLAFGISLLLYVPFRFSINEIDLVEHEILLALELACFLCDAKLFAKLASLFVVSSLLFLRPGCKLSYEEGCWGGWRGSSVN